MVEGVQLMAMVRRCRSMELNRTEEDKLRLGFGCVGCSRGLGRKRIAISSNLYPLRGDSLPMKRKYSGRIVREVKKSDLELLPHDVLVKVFCGVEHEDLKHLSQVSRTIREATLIAKKCHFEYTTPRKSRTVRTLLDSENQVYAEDMETPRAPLRTFKKTISREAIAEVSTVLFGSEDVDELTGRGFYAESAPSIV